ncbi:CpsD/CapB family tyrosine-protein kinase [Aquabacterium sp. A08]|uniref:CpsD/CapB family tyrosine-protein kinase n=1 Tax=Aquabacterium sp. A08 TaxID=2718532 RepID=UPI0014216D9D|nr:CpsD/CapB family tyrosine-protein kinase [Aquabacterium sp. A08]NIC41028.1 CpsD/CapB family tyrosine-protein kinase [Aquabacterium sp. A08]
MERIKLAIEKAKSQGPGSAPVAPIKAWPTVPSVAHVANDEHIEVQYTQTDVVQLDAAHLERHRVVAFNKHHPANWAFDLLRTQVLRKMDENGWRTLAITSPSMESGKSVVAINLAVSIAHQSQRTAMLVDFDLRRPQVANYLGLKRDTSLNDVLSGAADVSQALVNPGLPRLVVLPTARPVPKSSEVLSSRKVGHIIGDLRDRYADRIVIFDLPPILAADDVIAVLPRIDCVLMIVGSGMSTQKAIEEAMRHLGGANLLGVVLNKDETPVRKGYY